MLHDAPRFEWFQRPGNSFLSPCSTQSCCLALDFPLIIAAYALSAHPCSDPTYFLNPWIPWFKMFCKISGCYWLLLWDTLDCFNQDVSRFSSSSHKINHGPPCFTEFDSRHRMNVMLQSILAKPSSQRTPAPHQALPMAVGFLWCEKWINEK